MTIDKDKLRALAEEVKNHPFDPARGIAFQSSVNPDTILVLLGEIERLSSDLSACKTSPGGCAYWREAAKLREIERDQLKAENEALRKSLLEASEEIATWGTYASEYFQKKHNLAGCVKKFQLASMTKGIAS